MTPRDAEPFVYEAVPPRNHNVPLAEYRKLMEEKLARRPVTWFVIQPMDRCTPSQLAAMKAHTESELGRRYMLRGWWKGHEVRGVFRSELVANIIEKSGKMSVSQIIDAAHRDP